MSATYTFRPSALEKEKTLELTQEHLMIHQGQRTDDAPYASIKSVRLYYDPSRFATNKYQCEITLKNHATVLIKSVHYAGPTNFEDRASDYRAFITELHEHLAPLSDITFLAGNKPGCFSLNVLMIIATVVFVVIALFSFGSAIGLAIIFRLILFAGLLYWGIKYLKRNKPKTYNPDNLPSSVLPN
ncbi:MAG: hypothetical protein RIC80_05215 [Cyclobacteriaceae bacterium]